jgi:hypothetical protein
MTHNTPHLTTRIQLARALALAAAHGHGWSHVVYDDLQDNPDLDTTDMLKLYDLVGITTADCEKLIAEARTRQSPDWPGIEAPYFDCDGDIWHETQTGRLTWNIAPDGTTSLTVHRPGHAACWAKIMPDGNFTADGGQDGRTFLRHVDTLTRAISAITGIQADVLKPLWDAAEEAERERLSCQTSALRTAFRDLLADIEYAENLGAVMPSPEEVGIFIVGDKELVDAWLRGRPVCVPTEGPVSVPTEGPDA